MEDYLHAAKVGRHSVVELAQSYLKGYVATWWRTVKQEEGKNHGYTWEFFNVATLALGSQPRQRGCKVAGQEEGSPGVKAKALQGYGPRGSRGVTSHIHRSVRKCEGVNTHTPKATPTLRDCHNPTLGLSVRMQLTLPKVGKWSPPGLPKT